MILGTAVRIADTVSVSGGGSVSAATITITDFSDTAIVTDAAMTNEGSGVWSYTWQSLGTQTAGLYTADISMTAGSYTAKTRVKFEMEAA